MNDDETTTDSEGGTLRTSHTIGDTLATRAALAALLAQLAAEREGGPNFLLQVYRDADRMLRRAVTDNPSLDKDATAALENIIDAAEASYETLTGLLPGSTHSMFIDDEEI